VAVLHVTCRTGVNWQINGLYDIMVHRLSCLHCLSRLAKLGPKIEVLSVLSMTSFADRHVSHETLGWRFSLLPSTHRGQITISFFLGFLLFVASFSDDICPHYLNGEVTIASRG
jgi:hypothetical protein